MSEIGFLDGHVTAGMAAKALEGAGYEARALPLSHGCEEIRWMAGPRCRTGGSLTIEPHDPARGEDLAPWSRLWTSSGASAHRAIGTLARTFGGVSLLVGIKRPPAPPLRDILENGGCFAFALHLHECTGLPLCALYDYWGNPQHVMVLDEDARTVIDTRGATPLREAAYFGNVPCVGFRLATIGRDAVEEHAARNAFERGNEPSRDDMDGFIQAVPALGSIPLAIRRPAP